MSRYLASVNSQRELLEAWEKVKSKAPFDVIFFEVRCKYCDSGEISKFGRYKNMQRWWCNHCKRKFTDNRAAPGMKIPEDRIQSAISMYFKGVPINIIRKQLLEDYNYYPSESIIHKWVYRYAEKILAYTKDHHPQVGNHWMAFESTITVGSDKFWILDLIDFKTHFLLSSMFSTDRSLEDFRMLLESAGNKAQITPDKIIAKRKFSKIIEQFTGKSNRREILKSPIQQDRLNLTSYWKYVISVRRKIMRGQKVLAVAQSTLEGWIFYQNYIVLQKSLKEKSAAQEAEIEYSYKANLRVEEFRI